MGIMSILRGIKNISPAICAIALYGILIKFVDDIYGTIIIVTISITSGVFIHYLLNK